MSNVTSEDISKALQYQLGKSDWMQVADMSNSDFQANYQKQNDEGSKLDSQAMLARLAQSMNADHQHEVEYAQKHPELHMKVSAEAPKWDESGQPSPEMLAKVKELKDKFENAGLSGRDKEVMIDFIGNHEDGRVKDAAGLKGEDAVKKFAEIEGIDPNDKRAVSLAIIAHYKEAENNAHSNSDSLDGNRQINHTGGFTELATGTAVMGDMETKLIRERTREYEAGHQQTQVDTQHPKLMIDADFDKIKQGDAGELAKLKAETAGHTKAEFEDWAKNNPDKVDPSKLQQAEALLNIDKAPSPSSSQHPKMVIDADFDKIKQGDAGELAKLKAETAGHSKAEFEEWAKNNPDKVAPENVKQAEVALKLGSGHVHTSDATARTVHTGGNSGPKLVKVSTGDAPASGDKSELQVLQEKLGVDGDNKLGHLSEEKMKAAGLKVDGLGDIQSGTHASEEKVAAFLALNKDKIAEIEGKAKPDNTLTAGNKTPDATKVDVKADMSKGGGISSDTLKIDPVALQEFIKDYQKTVGIVEQGGASKADLSRFHVESTVMTEYVSKNPKAVTDIAKIADHLKLEAKSIDTSALQVPKAVVSNPAVTHDTGKAI